MKQHLHPFGDIIDFDRDPSFQINNGKCDRYHALAQTDVLSEGGNAVVNLFRGTVYELAPEACNDGTGIHWEVRHSCQCSPHPYLVIIAPDEDGAPGMPIAFRTKPGQGVNYHRNIMACRIDATNFTS